MTSVRPLIIELYKEAITTINSNLTEELTDQTILLESGLDSLGFAILVARLEEELGYDPFTIMQEPVYPNTFKEFVDIYEQNKPK